MQLWLQVKRQVLPHQFKKSWSQLRSPFRPVRRFRAPRRTAFCNWSQILRFGRVRGSFRWRLGGTVWLWVWNCPLWPSWGTFAPFLRCLEWSPHPGTLSSNPMTPHRRLRSTGYPFCPGLCFDASLPSQWLSLAVCTLLQWPKSTSRLHPHNWTQSTVPCLWRPHFAEIAFWTPRRATSLSLSSSAAARTTPWRHRCRAFRARCDPEAFGRRDRWYRKSTWQVSVCLSRNRPGLQLTPRKPSAGAVIKPSFPL